MKTWPARVRLKPISSSHISNTLPDILWTSINALKEAEDAFPPPKSAVAGAISLCDIAEVSILLATR
jgi:hypothetical protein